MNRDESAYAGVNRECFGCGKLMIEDYPDPERPHNPLHANWLGATDWTSVGNWCSRKLDCMMDTDFSRAHIVICDECFEERKHRIVRIEYSDEEKKKNKEVADKRFLDLRDFIKNEFKPSPMTEDERRRENCGCRSCCVCEIPPEVSGVKP